MTENSKTTLYLDPDDYRRLKALARIQGRPSAELVREAVAEYVKARAGAGKPSSVGAFRSGRHDLSERTDELLTGFGQT